MARKGEELASQAIAIEPFLKKGYIKLNEVVERKIEVQDEGMYKGDEVRFIGYDGLGHAILYSISDKREYKVSADSFQKLFAKFPKESNEPKTIDEYLEDLVEDFNDSNVYPYFKGLKSLTDLHWLEWNVEQGTLARKFADLVEFLIKIK
jgi:hypothetical protein